MGVHETRSRPIVSTGLVVAALACGCGAIHSTAAPDSGVPCIAQPLGLLLASDMPTSMGLEGPPTTVTTLGLLGSDNADYLGFVGASRAYFQWTGLSSGEGQTDVALWWTSQNESGPPGSGDFPHSGALFSDFPKQVLQVAEQVSDFGVVSNAQNWMASQRQEHQPNTVPDYGYGVQGDPVVPTIGDDTFMYQIDNGAPYSSTPYTASYVGDVYTNIEVRQSQIVYAIAIDASPGVEAVSLGVSLIEKLIASEAGQCPLPSPLPAGSVPTPTPDIEGSPGPTPWTYQPSPGTTAVPGPVATPATP
jgi:hypothetical protein